MKIEINDENWYLWLMAMIEIVWIRALSTNWHYIILELQLVNEKNPLPVFSLPSFAIIWGAANVLFFGFLAMCLIINLMENGFSITIYDSTKNNPEEEDKLNK